MDDLVYLIIGSILGFFSVAIIFLVILILLQRRRTELHNKLIYRTRDYINNRYFKGDTTVEPPTNKRFMLQEFYRMEDQIHFPPRLRKHILNDLKDTKLYAYYRKNLNSYSRTKRILSAYYLGLFRYNDVYDILVQRLQKEKDESVQFYIVYSLIKYTHKDAFLHVVESLVGSSMDYQKKITALIINRFNLNNTYLFNLEHREENEIILLLLSIAEHHNNAFLQQYVQTYFETHRDRIMGDWAKDDIETLLNKASMKAIFNIDRSYLNLSELALCKKEWVRLYALKLYRDEHSFDAILELLSLADSAIGKEQIADTILVIIKRDKSYINKLLNEFEKQISDNQKDIIVLALSSVTDYILYKIHDEEKIIRKITSRMIRLQKSAAIIDFLNENKDDSIRQKLLPVLKSEMDRDSEFEHEVRMYLDKSLLEQLGTSRAEPIQNERQVNPIDINKIVWMLVILVITLLIYPIFYLINSYDIILTLKGMSLIYDLIININYNLAIYFIILNTIYITFVIVSFFSTKKQIALWNIKSNTMLFENRLLPGISVIAPAYNEEISIIESVKSLLNLKYPDYEVIVVNDGSSDKTLQTLIEYFELERKNPVNIQKLQTKFVRGIYTNTFIPKLKVIDKINGGKADALNVGINYSSKQYICGIDADSLLESDSLLRAISITLDYPKPHIAIGGQIAPVNGCTIDHGKVETFNLGKNPIVKMQTLEYMRAFNSGRLGWSEINSLLLISGAFGIFDKIKIIEVGGYLSSSGVYKKDSVGEDMELVVRLTNNALQNKEQYRVSYVYHAMCFTELPSSFKILFRQRNRWHRGLIDILHFHRKMIFDYKYKIPGMVGMPYFFFFEMVGPFLETIGYAMLLTGLALGVLSPYIVLGIFLITIFYGIVLSLSALYVNESKNRYTNRKVTLWLIAYAFLENLGYRQMVSIHRVKSFFSALKNSGKWGAMKRTGFKK
ncbi:MAG: glycosyltransferase [Candidatus Izemoplasma sp.]|nr:glycosyltransferase [Candidatus Izemoplasma sp.]